MGRTAPLIPALRKQLKLHHVDKEIGERIMAEARSFALDPIRYNIGRFHVDIAHPPQYRPVEIQHTSLSDGMFQVPLVPGKQEVPEMERDPSPGKEADLGGSTYVPPSVMSVTSQDSIYRLSAIQTKKPEPSFTPEKPFSQLAALNFAGDVPPKKFKPKDHIPALPASDLMILPTTVPDPFHALITPLPHIPHTVAATTVLHLPPQESAVSAAATQPTGAREGVPVQHKQEVRRERADSAIADVAEPEAHTGHQTQDERQLVPYVQIQREGQVDDDRALQILRPRSSERSERRSTPSHNAPATRRRNWIRRLFSRHERSTMPDNSSQAARRGHPLRPPPSNYSSGGTWGHARASSHHHRYPELESGGGSGGSPPPRSPQQPCSDGDAGDHRKGSRKQSSQCSRSGDGGRWDGGSCRTYEDKAYVVSRKQGSRTRFALLSFNRRKYDE